MLLRVGLRCFLLAGGWGGGVERGWGWLGDYEKEEEVHVRLAVSLRKFARDCKSRYT